MGKIFVGGIPQSVDSTDLYKLFSKVAKVKKAWLQTYSQERCVSNARKHRGFGFIIFSDKQAVDQLLGEDTSKFVKFGDGLEFEVKRAVGKLMGVPLTPDLSHRHQHTPNRKSHAIETSPHTVSASHSASLQSTPASSFGDACSKFPQLPPFPSPSMPVQE